MGRWKLVGRTAVSGVGSAAGAGVESTYAAGGAGLRSWVGGEASGVWIGTVRRVGIVADWRVCRRISYAAIVGRFASCKAHKHLTTFYDGSSPLLILHQKALTHAPGSLPHLTSHLSAAYEDPELGVASESPQRDHSLKMHYYIRILT